jgi:hypothetical protein
MLVPVSNMTAIKSIGRCACVVSPIAVSLVLNRICRKNVVYFVLKRMIRVNYCIVRYF